MAHVDDRDAHLVAQPLDVVEDLGLARRVERGKRLVQQQHFGIRQQRAADRHALLLAAGKRAGTTLEQVADAQQFNCLVKPKYRVPAVREKASVGEVMAHREVRQQAAFLEHVADTPRMRRKRDAGCAVIQRPLFDRDAARLRASQPRDQVEDGALAGSGAAEERRDAAAGRKRGVERKASDAAADVELKHRGRRRAPWRGARGLRRPSTRRATGGSRGCTGAAPARRPRAPG